MESVGGFWMFTYAVLYGCNTEERFGGGDSLELAGVEVVC